MSKTVSQKAAAKEFADRWCGRGDEKQDAQSFWRDLLASVFGIPAPQLANFISFERRVQGGFIDAFIEDTGVLIEQKGQDIDLLKPQKQSDGTMLTPYEQAARYASRLPLSIRPRWIITCNFKQFYIYDQEAENPAAPAAELALENLATEYYCLNFLVDKANSRIERERELSVKAGEIVGKLYSLLSSQYLDIDNNMDEQRSLNVLIVRLVFCLYAEDAELFHKRDAFLEYLRAYEAPQFRDAVKNLFKVLDTPKDQRDPYMDPELLKFPYVNGGLFADENIIIPQFTQQIRTDLLLEASQKFDWSGISPTIFGAAFESTLNPETRRSGGMHYTSIENIHKVIDPLFLDDLKAELEQIEAIDMAKKRKNALRRFQDKLASINIFDPACGSGNFLTESYISLRKLENRAIEGLQGDQIGIDFEVTESPVKVSISQLYGIEINDFAVSVAKTALWIAEAQMTEATQEIVYTYDFDFLPLKTNANIHEGNALRMDWNDVLPAEKCSYICGNPPFLGKSYQDSKQKSDMKIVFDGVKNFGNLDYVTCWFKKACDFMGGVCECAFVTTNSICQGIAVAPLWAYLFEHGIEINFAYKTFVWDNEASNMAHVHCSIVGISRKSRPEKFIIDRNGEIRKCDFISAYLIPGNFPIIENQARPVSEDVPEMIVGSCPTDGGNLIIQTPEELSEMENSHPEVRSYIRPYIGGNEFINNKKRWCLWLKNVPREEISQIPVIEARVEGVERFRRASKKEQTRRRASTPNLFAEDRQTDSDFIFVPMVSSFRRKYIPIGFLSWENVANNKSFVIPHASIYHFGIITSQFHNAWMRTMAGRLKSDYSYTTQLVYNTFSWPNPTDELRFAIEACAQAVLDARDAHPGKCLADLYDPDKMPEDLLTAHKALDAAVEAAYGVDFNGDEEKIVAHLFKLYAELTSKENQ